MDWTEARIERLKQLWASGLSATQIAAEMGGVSRNQVIGKVHRLGLEGRAQAGRVEQAASRGIAAKSMVADREQTRRFADGSPAYDARYVNASTGKPSRARAGKDSQNIADLLSHANRVFGNPAKARSWMSSPNRGLDDSAPLDLLNTPHGRQQVQAILYRIEYGIFS